MLAFPGAWHLVSGGARRGFEAKGDLLPALEGYPAGEMKHGPIALVDEYCPVIAILGEGLPARRPSPTSRRPSPGAPV